MVQMEVATPVTGFNPAGALTIAGPNPNINNMPNSNPFAIHGEDAPSCPTPEADHPAIGGYDDPNADPPTNSISTITAALPNPDHYTGAGGTPSIQNVYGSLGETMSTPTGLKSVIDGVQSKATNTGNTLSLGTAAVPAVNYINGDLTISGNATGYGVLLVTGTLVMSGDFSWYGVVLVIGDGNFSFSGGGNGQIQGTLFVAKIWDGYATRNLLSTLGSPYLNWNGGGGNGIQYDSCLIASAMGKIPIDVPPSTRPLKILSTRILPY